MSLVINNVFHIQLAFGKNGFVAHSKVCVVIRTSVCICIIFDNRQYYAEFQSVLADD